MNRFHSLNSLNKQVLVPEAIVALISEDLGVDHAAAVEALHSSTEFGTHYHSDPRDCDRSRNNIANDNSHTSSQQLTPATPTTSQATSMLPLSSPLLSPHTLATLSTPLLIPAAWDTEPEPEPEPIDAALLCSYCDEKLPALKSETLVDMDKKLLKLSWPDPLPENPGRRRTPHVTMTLGYCERHRFEALHLPKGMLEGWPFQPNFEGLFRRIVGLQRELLVFLKRPTESSFYNVAYQFYNGKMTKLQTVKEQFNLSTRLAQIGAG